MSNPPLAQELEINSSMAQMTAVNDAGKTDESTGAGLRLCEFGVKVELWSFK
jgi:hypothetical protein